MVKYHHEFRDPVHQFITVTSHERTIVDSEPVQRLRYIAQLALSSLVTRARRTGGSSTASVSWSSPAKRSTS
ncbi:hypothetical protein OF117_15790 [Geodermatophilus sp. YIM 151500]|uniref:hypothetical protein n=1 Tax=Geodermatophilus sp. YIM 151500 TaxID=2984531 RepID=UPI0021E4869E|nr:hypothetical protein [Geodermatophilus sp. YIM 151500]MCV2490818.1 hypothetical protein [Geodermatophilus sp. YIM 151500]